MSETVSEEGAQMVKASIALVALLLAGCGSTGSGSGAVSAPEIESSPTTSAGSSSITTESTPTTAAPLIPVLPNEPWLVHTERLPGEDTRNLFLVRPDGSDDHIIATDVPGDHHHAAWSPDGTQIAFANHDSATPNGSIWIANADGTGPTLVTDGGERCGQGIDNPAWFEDGTRLAAICYADDVNTYVVVIDLTTKAVTPIINVAWPEYLGNAPTVSPDGKSIAFDIIQWDPTNTFEAGSLIAVVSSTGGTEHRLTSFDTFMAHPDWSPDGQELVMNSYDMGNIQATDQPSNIYAMKPDGTGLRQITHSSVNGAMRIGQPHWAPDGTQIVVGVGTASGTDNKIDKIHPAFVDATGGEPVLVSTDVIGGAPDLRPTT